MHGTSTRRTFSTPTPERVGRFLMSTPITSAPCSQWPLPQRWLRTALAKRRPELYTWRTSHAHGRTVSSGEAILCPRPLFKSSACRVLDTRAMPQPRRQSLSDSPPQPGCGAHHDHGRPERDDGVEAVVSPTWPKRKRQVAERNRQPRRSVFRRRRCAQAPPRQRSWRRSSSRTVAQFLARIAIRSAATRCSLSRCRSIASSRRLTNATANRTSSG